MLRSAWSAELSGLQRSGGRKEGRTDGRRKEGMQEGRKAGRRKEGRLEARRQEAGRLEAWKPGSLEAWRSTEVDCRCQRRPVSVRFG
jgi:hypothetical protein